MDSAGVFTSSLPPNSDHVMIHLGGYNCSGCTYSFTVSCGQQIALLYPPKRICGLNWVATTEDVNT